MTEGSGGGTIATTALYNGFSKIATETLNLKFINLGKKLLTTGILNHIHSLADVTNGGLRGDAFEISNTANVNISIYDNAFKKLVNPEILNMLMNLEIDPLGVSIDSLLLILPERFVDETLAFIRSTGISAGIVGRVEDDILAKDQTPVVRLFKGKIPEHKVGNPLVDMNAMEIESIELKPHYREEPYTPIKRVVNIEPENQTKIQDAIDHAMNNSKKKKEDLKNWLRSKHLA
jgi:hydrogenase expression/formation protein